MIRWGFRDGTWTETADGLCSVAAATIGAGVLAAGATAYSGSQAAGAQGAAAGSAIQAQLQMFNQTRSDLGPFRDVGANAALQLGDLADLKGNPLTSALLSPVTMDQATLEKTPGYQFNLTQGLKAVQNSAAARGLGLSGAALKGASSYATGLADSTYQNQFNNALTNRNLALNGLMGIANLGENAAAQTGAAATTTGQGVASSLIGAGNATAGAYMAGANSLTGGANNVSQYALLQSLLNKNQNAGMYNFGPDLTSAGSAPSSIVGGIGASPY